MNAQEQILQFLKQCAKTIKTQSKDPIILEGSDVFRKKLESADNKQFSAKLLPVLKNIKSISSTPYTFNFHQIATQMVWRPSPRTDEKGQRMALSLINDMVDLGDLIVGLLLVDKHESYPLHQHQPQELYLILSGEAEWRYGGSESYRKLVPGDVIYNHPNDMHGVTAHDEPLLAMYVLWN